MACGIASSGTNGTRSHRRAPCSRVQSYAFPALVRQDGASRQRREVYPDAATHEAPDAPNRYDRDVQPVASTTADESVTIAVEYRYWITTGNRYFNVGFRVARTLTP